MLCALCLALAAALLRVDVERTLAADARLGLAKQQPARAEENSALALAALADLQRTIALVAPHAKNQQGNVDVYEQKPAVPDGRAAALLTLTTTGCAGSTEPTPPVIASRPQLTSLPASVSRIDPQSLQPWLHEVESFLNEGRLVVEGRDNEVQLLLGTVKKDRALLTPP